MANKIICYLTKIYRHRILMFLNRKHQEKEKKYLAYYQPTNFKDIALEAKDCVHVS